MLTLFRDLVRSKVALVIIGLLILSLALFGVPDFFGSLLNKNLGTSLMRADSRRLEASDVERFANNVIQNDRRNAQAEAAQTGNEPRQVLTKQDLAASGQLSQMINLLSDMEIRGAYVDKLGVGASKQEIADWIRDVDALQNEITSGFDRERYAQFIQQRGFETERQFEGTLMTELSFDNVRAGLNAALQPPTGMADLWSIFQSETRNIAYFTFSVDDLPEAVERPTDEEILTFYNERQHDLTEPERRQFSVIAITPQDFTHKLTVSDEDVRNEYEAQIFKYSGPASRTYSLLYFDTPEAAQTALGLLVVGEPVEDVGGVLVANLSAVEGSVAGPDYQAQIFASPIDLWNGVIEMSDGRYALINVAEEIPGEKQPFEEVEANVRAELIAARAERLFDRSIDDIDDAVGAGFTLEEMADIVGSPVYTYPPVDQRGVTKDGLPIINLMMMQDALSYGFQLYPEETGDRREAPKMHYIMRLDRIVEPTIPSLEDIREDLGEALYIRKQNEALNDCADAALLRIQSRESSITTEAMKLNKEVTRPAEAISRTRGQAQGYSQTALNQIFNAALDQPFIAPLQRGILLGVVEDIQIPQGDELVALRSASDTDVLPSLAADMEQGFSLLAQQNVDVDLNGPMIDAYLEQYQVQE